MAVLFDGNRELNYSVFRPDRAYRQVGSLVGGTITTVKSLGQYPGEYSLSITTVMDDLVKQPFQFKQPTETQINNFRDNVYNKFIDSVVKNLEKRFPHIKDAFGVFDPQQWQEGIEMLEDFMRGDRGNKTMKKQRTCGAKMDIEGLRYYNC